MSFEECNRILNLFGISMKDQVFDILVRQVDKDHSGGLTLNEFAVVQISVWVDGEMLQRLKMLSLFQDSVIKRLLGYFGFICFLTFPETIHSEK